MRHYEVTLILDPSLEDKDAERRPLDLGWGDDLGTYYVRRLSMRRCVPAGRWVGLSVTGRWAFISSTGPTLNLSQPVATLFMLVPQ